MKKLLFPIFFLSIHLSGIFPVEAQEKVVIDQIVAVVGNSAILESDIVNQSRQLQAQGMNLGPNPECAILDDMLYQKLLYNQAVLDSLEVSDEMVEQVLERRLRYFIAQIGSREKLEAYYGKSVDELKEEFRDIVREQELSQQMEGKITANVKVTPSEVRIFFNRLPEDSIPMVESELVLGQIVKKPPVQPEEIAEVKSRLEEFKQRVINGESFSTLAILYSEDPGSARRGGELGFFGRGELYPEFEAAAFNLRPGELSDIVETEAGYHLIQMIERRGEQFNVRHILLLPKVSPLDLMAARQELDSIRTLIEGGEMTFAEAALKFSDDPGKINQGLMVNPYTGTTRFKSEEIEPNLFFVIDQLEVGAVSAPIGMMTEEGQQAFRIVQLQSRTDPHRGNLQQDYDYIQQLALDEKKRKATEAWINRRLPNTYVFIHEKFRGCSFELDWVKEP
ncbi:MAG: peptidylprolyl isomerase [Bacteroidales bacterium]|jgi:peptidyl-prolyl cis-trans isomerase SurA|nr:peptidylprolyl isomerase [Bacteroidales bacterium]NLM92713.1 peptidylprolyl isomerase [Bacteroidales bacterium]